MFNPRQVIDNQEHLDFFLASRPVYARNQDIGAVELLVQHHGTQRQATLDDIESALTLVLGTYGNISQRGKMQTVPAFLRIPGSVLLDPALPDLPQKHSIIEIAAPETAAAAVADKVRQLSARGYRLCLANYHPDRDSGADLLDAVHIVKLDWEQLDDSDIVRACAALRPHGIDLLACQLDNREQFRRAMELGCTLFQGSFFGQATPIQGKKIASNKQFLLQLLTELQSPDATAARLEKIAIRDADFTYRILKIVNSVAVGSGKTIKSISHAMSMLGIEEIRRWVHLFLIEGSGDKPEHLTRNMLIRGRMCEILAYIAEQPNPSDYFIVGLLSQLDTLTDIAMPELMRQVPLSQPIKDALLDHRGDLGLVLLEVEHYERGQFHHLHWLKQQSYYETAYRHSTAWATHVQLSLQG